MASAQDVVVEQAERLAKRDERNRADASRSGGAYVPPFKLAQLRKVICVITQFLLNSNE